MTLRDFVLFHRELATIAEDEAARRARNAAIAAAHAVDDREERRLRREGWTHGEGFAVVKIR